jgi:hypothetical protein
MEESAPPTAAPKESAAPDEKARDERKRLRVPTSVIVTLLGIALTAWLLPAFTRQWDDRQKAHELKVGLVSEIASATASAVATGETIQGGARTTETSRANAHRQWSLAALQVDGRLRAYFPGSTIAVAWQIYTYALGRFSGVSGGAVERILGDFAYTVNARVRVAEAEGDVETAEDVVDREVLARAFPEEVWRDIANVVHALNGIATDPQRRASFSQEERALLNYLTTVFPVVDAAVRPLLGYIDPAQLEPTLLRLEQELTSEILASHPTGYSTSFRDLVNDLLP